MTLDKLLRADVWIALTQVQFADRDYQNRYSIAPLARLRELFWATVPVRKPRGRETWIEDLKIVMPSATAERMERQAVLTYGRSEHRAQLDELLATVVVAVADDRLADAGIASAERMLRRLGWRGDVHLDAEFDPRPHRTLRLVDLVAGVGGTTYLCGPGGRSYLQTAEFDAAGLNLEFVMPFPVRALGIDETSRSRRSSLDYLARVGLGGLGDILRHHM